MYIFLYIFKQVTSKIWFDVLFRGEDGFMKNVFRSKTDLRKAPKKFLITNASVFSSVT